VAACLVRLVQSRRGVNELANSEERETTEMKKEGKNAE
jgi:hypothetical protein